MARGINNIYIKSYKKIEIREQYNYQKILLIIVIAE
jgi:hypothetical protein